MAMATKLFYIESLLDQLITAIDRDTQFDDIIEIYEELEEMTKDNQLLTSFNNLSTEVYCCKGAMYDTLPIIEKMKDECFQLRLFHLLTDN